MRITGGQWKGREIHTVKDNAVRPTTAKVRESVFQILRDEIPGAVFLDIFAGSGLMGFEALSRGAKRVIAIEKDPRHRALILKNAQHLGVSSEQYQCLLGDALQLPTLLSSVPTSSKEWSGAKREAFVTERCSNGADVVFIDPPFRPPFVMSDVEGIITDLVHHQLVKPSGIMVWEYPKRFVPQAIENATCIDTRHYGDASVGFYQPVPATESE